MDLTTVAQVHTPRRRRPTGSGGRRRGRRPPPRAARRAGRRRAGPPRPGGSGSEPALGTPTLREGGADAELQMEGRLRRIVAWIGWTRLDTSQQVSGPGRVDLPADSPHFIPGQMIAYSLQPVNSNLAEKAEKQAFSQRQERDKRGDKGEKRGLRPARRRPLPARTAGPDPTQQGSTRDIADTQSHPSRLLLRLAPPGRFVVVCRLRGFPLYHTELSVQAPTDTPSTRQGGDGATPDPPPLYSTAAASGVASYSLTGRTMPERACTESLP